MVDLFIAAYVFCGIALTFKESASFEYEDEFTQETNVEVALDVVIYAVHFLRYCLTFPLYLAEDYCISRLNKAAEARESS
jgi:histidinol phosphatase-like PHP family hydrolase